ncbi:hypothetical protein X975_25945, partial [Stegodyphus mimosarum]
MGISRKMWLFYIFLFTLSECFPRSPLSQEMCEDGKINDCSFQIADAPEESCVVYNTAACKNFDFSNWTQAPVTKLTSEFAAPFTVSIIPYAAELLQLQKGLPVSAINITFTIFKEGIEGFIVLITDDSKPKNMCRIFDFRNAVINKRGPSTLFYDCLYKLVEDKMQNVHIEFRALPINVELSYYVFIPAVPEFASVCDWQPLIMIFNGSLSKHTVQVRFTQAPSHLNVSSYVVKLISAHSKTIEKVIEVTEDSESDLMTVEFLNVDEGYYSLAVNVVGCAAVKTKPFYVGSEGIGMIIIIYVCAVIFFISLAALIFLIFWRLFKQHMSIFSPESKPVVLFVYSADSDEHNKFVQAYENYLTAHCNVRVVTIYGITGDPHDWLKKKYLESDIIMFIISEGMFHFFDRGNKPPMKVYHHWHKQLPDAVTHISVYRYNSFDDVPKKRKYCKVCFPYSSQDHIPKCLGKEMGQCFFLPEEIPKLLYFIFGCSPEIYPKAPGRNIKSFEKGQELIKKINIMKNEVKAGTHITYKHTKKTENSSGNGTETINDLCLNNENDTEKYKEYEAGKIVGSSVFIQAVEEFCGSDKEHEHLLNNVAEDDTDSCNEYSLRDHFRRN